ncbi:MAG: FAD-dependent oxidoreductase [Chloroflexi bacterium]|nr:FAD-dependent oxidoreductase [Chloroflexota bacterium]
MKMLKELPRETPIVAEADVLVIGGGPAGLGAAIAAARHGSETMLLERYGYLGGLASGGLVLLWDDLSDGRERVIGGIPQEILERLSAMGAAVCTPPEALGQASPSLWQQWGRWGFINWFQPGSVPKSIVYCCSVDPEALKYVADEMVTEAGVQLRLHTLAVGAIVEEDQVKGAVVESKSGREAILAKVTIDASGDGDIFAVAGAEHRRGQLPLTLVHRLGNVDTEKAMRYEEEHPEEAARLDAEVKAILGCDHHFWWMSTVRKGVVWINAPTYKGLDALSIEDRTYIEREARKRIWHCLDFVRRNLPGFEAAYLLDTASQLGVRQSRLLSGEYIVTKEDISEGRYFADAVGRARNYFIPYRSLIPKRLNGLLVAGRCYSATRPAQLLSREIAPCMVMGQAAGTAAALAVEGSLRPREVNVSLLQGSLARQGVIL